MFWLILAAALLLLVEAGCFVLVRSRPDLFDRRIPALNMLQPDYFARFKEQHASAVLGWDHPASRTITVRSCTGAELIQTYGAARERVQGNSEEAVVLVTGDSFTHGDDAADTETYPAELERMLGVATANLGVGGYDPLQALLKLEASVRHFPKARIGVLSISHDDAYRLPNSFRPVLFASTGLHFGLKPYVRDGHVHGLVGGDPFRDLNAMHKAAWDAFDTDYWRRAQARFPYSRAVAEMLSLPSFWVPQLLSLGELFGYPPFDLVYRLPEIATDLRTVYARFAAFAKSSGLIPVVVLIPEHMRDAPSGLVAIAAATPEQRAAITFVNAAWPDPAYYTKTPGCHPQAQGYRLIAETVAEALRPLLSRERP